MPADHRFDIIAIAASAGGFAALGAVIEALPADFPVPVLALLHRSGARSDVEQLIGRRARLKVRRGQSGEPLQAGSVYFAPGGCHTTVSSRGVISVQAGEPIGFVRPSADLLFTSIGDVYAERAIGCVLSGMGSDGARGIADMRRHGGFIIAQRPLSCAYPGMPASAIETRKVDLVLDLGRIAAALITLTGGADQARPRRPSPKG